VFAVLRTSYIRLFVCLRMQASKPHKHPNIHLYEVANTKGHKHKKHSRLPWRQTRRLCSGESKVESKKAEPVMLVESQKSKVESNHMDKLRTEHLFKTYGKRTVVNDVSIEISQGEIVGLLGPNGAGKTTTFYMTTGLVVSNHGKIYYNDIDITELPMYERAQMGIGYLPQEASVFRKMSVEDNIMSVLEMTNFSKSYRAEKLEHLIREFNLSHVRANLGDRLSGGERRRTEIARCLAIEPKFVMLDEPFAGVDPIAVQEIQDVVWSLKAKNIGILITDHNVDETLMITDRAYLLFEGKILFHGTPEELAANDIVRNNYLGRNFELKRKH